VKDDDMENEISNTASPVPPAGLGRRRRRRCVLPVAAALLGLAFVAAACSSDPSSPGVAGSGSGTTPTTAASTANQGMPTLTPAQKAEELAHSQCMRSHGVPDYPDPDSQGRILIQGGPGTGSGIDPNSTAFKNAEKACQSLQPQPTAAQQAQAEQAALRQSECMRAHGIKDYPDPDIKNGRVSMSIQAGSGSDLNPNNPLFQAAQRVCMPNAPKLGAGGKTSGSGSHGNATTGGGQISSGP
jgi:hypothetical protein